MGNNKPAVFRIVPTEEAYIPVVYCPWCREHVVPTIEEFVREKDGKEQKVSVVSCSLCETVLNLEGNLKVQFCSEDEVREWLEFEKVEE